MTIAQRIHAISPFGPILGKELRIASRRRRNHLLRVLYLGGLLLFLMMVYASEAPRAYDSGLPVVYRMQQQAQLGLAFFICFSLFCTICMGLITPILTSTAINSEKLANTLSVLLMTPITSWQIVAGKLFSRLLIAFMLIGLSLPVLAVVRLLGGVELWQMIAVICIATSFAIGCAAIGLFFSAIINRAYAVILISYATMFLVYFLAPTLFFTVVSRGMNSPTSLLLRSLAISNPVVNLMFVCEPGIPFLRATGWQVWLPGVLAQLALATVLLIATSFIVRRHARREGMPAAITIKAPLGHVPPPLPVAPVVEAEDVPDEAATSVLPTPPLASETTVSDGHHSGVGNNPVLWREFRRPLMTGTRGRIAGILIILLLVITYGCFASAHALNDQELQMVYAVIFNGLYWLLVAVLSATAIAQEKESDTWTLLLTAPLSARRIIGAKLLGIARRMLWPTLLIVAHFTLFTITSVINSVQWFIILWVIITFNTVWAATGVYLSLRVKKVTTAVIINLMIALVLYAAVPAGMFAIGQLVSRNGGEDAAETTGLYIPYVYLANAQDRRWEPMRPYWFPVAGMVTESTYVTCSVLTGILHLVIAGVIVRMTVDRFDSLVGRAKQLVPIT